MKKIIVVLLVVMSFGCSIYDVTMDAVYISKIKKAEIYYHEDFKALHSLDDIHTYLNTHIDYKQDTWDTWSTTEEILTRGYGDCEDFAIAFMNIYFVVFGEKLDFILVDLSRTVVKGGWIDHALIISSNGNSLSPQSGEINQSYEICFKYNFDLFFY